MSTVKANNYYDTTGGSNAQLYGVASPPNSMGFRNRIINGDFRISQYNGTSSVTPSSSTYTIDRWKMIISPGGKLSTQQVSTAPTGFDTSLLVTSTSAYSPAAGDVLRFTQFIEGFNVADLGFGTASAQTVTISLWVRSSLTGAFPISLINEAANRTYVTTFNVNAANTWEYKTLTIPGDTTGTWPKGNGAGLGVSFDFGSGSSSNTASPNSWQSANASRTSSSVQLAATNGATFYITGVQLEAGTVASPFERRAYSVEFDMCRRYCEVYANTNGTDAGIPQYLAQVDVNNRVETTLLYYPKRAAPSITVSDVTKITWLSAANTGIICNSFIGTAVGTTTNSAILFFGVPSGVTVNTLSAVGNIIFNAAASITVSAEL